MNIKNYGAYLKAIVAVIGTIATVLQTQFPSDHWSQAVTAGITAVLVYITPNLPKTNSAASTTSTSSL